MSRKVRKLKKRVKLLEAELITLSSTFELLIDILIPLQAPQTQEDLNTLRNSMNKELDSLDELG